jgi:crossover junction endodeoxyribonuclease RusA
VNSYYAKTKRGVFISNKGRQFRDKAVDSVIEQLPGVFIDERMLVEVVLFPPDKRIRDVDNYNKSLLDAITHTGLWEDDALIDQLFNYRGKQARGGLCLVRITDAGPIIPVGGSPPMD